MKKALILLLVLVYSHSYSMLGRRVLNHILKKEKPIASHPNKITHDYIRVLLEQRKKEMEKNIPKTTNETELGVYKEQLRLIDYDIRGLPWMRSTTETHASRVALSPSGALKAILEKVPPSYGRECGYMIKIYDISDVNEPLIALIGAAKLKDIKSVIFPNNNTLVLQGTNFVGTEITKIINAIPVEAKEEKKIDTFLAWSFVGWMTNIIAIITWHMK